MINRRTTYLCWAILAFALGWAMLMARAGFAQSLDESFFEIIPGTIPVLLTVPHSMPSSALIPGVSVRNPCTECPQEPLTDDLAYALADELEEQTGGRPYLVRALFTRRQVDVNVPKISAYDDRDGEPYYRYWHDTISALTSEISATWGSGLLIDIHGHGLSGQDDIIVRGTRNGSTVKSLLNQYGPAALVGPNSVIGVMEAGGAQFTPDPSLPYEDQFEGVFDGGEDVAQHGNNLV